MKHMKHMKRWVQVCTAIGAAFLSACGHDAMTGTNELGDEIQCDSPSELEERFADSPGYDANGCSRTERMANVKPFSDEWTLREPGAKPATELGQLEQPITIATGMNAAVSVNVNNNGDVTRTNGVCRRNLAWQGGQPLSDRCIVPKFVGSLDWAIFPDVDHPDDFDYMRNRMLEAWSVWNKPVTCNRNNGSGSVTLTPALSATGERTREASMDDRFFLARIPVYPVFDTASTQYGGRAEIDNDFVSPIIPVRFGVQYYTYDYSGIALNHQIIEGIKADACLSPTDSRRAQRIANAYTWILAHELGHIFGMPHDNIGLMRRGGEVSCSELFSHTGSTVQNAPNKKERAIVASLRDSQQLILSSDHAGISDTDCADTAGLRVSVDDFFFGNFF